MVFTFRCYNEKLASYVANVNTFRIIILFTSMDGTCYFLEREFVRERTEYVCINACTYTCTSKPCVLENKNRTLFVDEESMNPFLHLTLRNILSLRWYTRVYIVNTRLSMSLSLSVLRILRNLWKSRSQSIDRGERTSIHWIANAFDKCSFRSNNTFNNTD